MSKAEEQLKKFIEIIDKDIYVECDGYAVFNTSGGYLYAYQLRLIADELDKRNKEWDDTINAYFERFEVEI